MSTVSCDKGKTVVPTLVPKAGPPIVTQEHLTGHEIAALHALGLPWVILDCETCSLKIRVSVVHPRSVATTGACAHSAPGHHLRQVIQFSVRSEIQSPDSIGADSHYDGRGSISEPVSFSSQSRNSVTFGLLA